MSRQGELTRRELATRKRKTKLKNKRKWPQWNDVMEKAKWDFSNILIDTPNEI
jgi:hypothetical protein